MRLILQEPGLSVAKVAILVGGPDWPTSVLCGIMRLDLVPILLGTTPVFFLIVPTLLTGSFTYMASLKLENGQPEFQSASTLATVFAAITAVVQFGAMVVAAFYLEQTVSNKGEELDKIEVDVGVKEREDKQEEINKCYKEVTQWDRVPFLAKALLMLSLATMVTSCYMVQLFSTHCFANYELTYTIEDNLDGDWTNLLLPLGRAACLLFIVSCLELYGYIAWAGREARKLMVRKQNDGGYDAAAISSGP
jgi:TRAP-type C4-dicarboxylate transport system permease small subunit